MPNPATGGSLPLGVAPSPPLSSRPPAQRHQYCSCTGSRSVGDSTYCHSCRSSGGFARIVRIATSVVSSTAEAKTNCCRRTAPSPSMPRPSSKLSAVSDAIRSCTASGLAKTVLARELRSSSSRTASIFASKCSCRWKKPSRLNSVSSNAASPSTVRAKNMGTISVIGDRCGDATATTPGAPAPAPPDRLKIAREGSSLVSFPPPRRG